MRAGIVRTMQELGRYPWAGHSAILGRVKREWQDTEEILRYFGTRQRAALKRYLAFVREGISLGRRSELVGGGLLRSVGGWSEVLSMRRRDIGVASDARILGSGDFVERVTAQAERREKETLRLRRKVPDLGALVKEVAKRQGIGEEKLKVERRTREVVKVTKLICQLAVRKFGYTGASVARFLGVTTSLVNRYAASGELPELREYA
jgi:hypothetical protein